MERWKIEAFDGEDNSWHGCDDAGIFEDWHKAEEYAKQEIGLPWRIMPASGTSAEDVSESGSKAVASTSAEVKEYTKADLEKKAKESAKQWGNGKLVDWHLMFEPNDASPVVLVALVKGRQGEIATPMVRL
jgi:hypothetical protein